MKKKILIISIVSVIISVGVLFYINREDSAETSNTKQNTNVVVVEEINSYGFDEVTADTPDAARVAQVLFEKGIEGFFTEFVISECTGEIPEEVLQYDVDTYYSIATDNGFVTAVVVDGEVIYWE